MRGTFTLCAMLLALFAPAASAQDPLRDLNCELEVVCVGPGMCPLGLPACVPRSCQPAFHCRSQAEISSECAQNVTIDGETCQVIVGFGARTNAPVNEVNAHVALTNGKVDAFNLPNTWIAPSAEVTAASGAADLGDLSAGLYTTNITTGDDQAHEWRHAGVVLYHGSSIAGGPQEFRAGVYILDATLESCYARLSGPASASTACPRVVPGDLLGPILP